MHKEKYQFYYYSLDGREIDDCEYAKSPKSAATALLREFNSSSDYEPVDAMYIETLGHRFDRVIDGTRMLRYRWDAATRSAVPLPVKTPVRKGTVSP